MNFKRKANKLLALLLSLSLAMSTNMPISVLANEAEAPEKESSAAEIAYAMSGEEVIGINLNANPVVIQSAVDVSGNSVAGCFELIYDADKDGVADAGEEKLAIDGVTAFDSALNVYGVYNMYYVDTPQDIFITMNSGTVSKLYGSYETVANNVNIYMNGGTATELNGMYSNNYSLRGGVTIVVDENASLTNEPVACGGYSNASGDIYINNNGSMQIGGDYTAEDGFTAKSLTLLRGSFIIPTGTTASIGSFNAPTYGGTARVILRGSLSVGTVSGYGKFVMAGGIISGEGANSASIYEPFVIESNIENPPFRFSSSSDWTVLEEDGVERYYVKESAFINTYVSITGYDTYYSLNDTEFQLLSSSSFYVRTPESGSGKLVLEYVPKQISVENKYSAPRGVVGQTYTAENPLVDLSIYPITNDTTEEYGEVKYAVKKATPLPAGLSLVKGKIVGTPTKACEDGQKVTIVVTGRNGSTANLNLTIKIVGDGTDEKDINELVQTDVENKKINLNGTSVVVMPSPEDSYYDAIYLDMDHDKLPDNNDPLIIDEKTYYDLYRYELIGYSDAKNAYEGDISITLKAGSFTKVYGIYGTEEAPVTVEGDVSIYLEGATVSNLLFGACYGKADNVAVSFTKTLSDNVDMCVAYESEIVKDVNFVFAEQGAVRGTTEADYAVVGVADSSTVGGDVNVKVGFESTDYGFKSYSVNFRPQYWTRFTGVSKCEVKGNINYSVEGIWIPGTNTMISDCTVGKDVDFNMASDQFASDSNFVVDSTIDGDLKIISDEETGFGTVSGDVTVIDGSSTVKGDLYIDNKKGGFGIYWEPIGENVSLEKGVYINDYGLITIGTAADKEYVIAEDVDARYLTVLEGADVKIAKGVNVTLTGNLNIESGAKLVNNGTLTMSSASGTITGTLENNGILTTTAQRNNGLTLANTGLVLNGENGVWNVACYLVNNGKIVNYGSFVQTYSYSSGSTYYYAKLGKVYTTTPLTLSGDPTTSAPYTTTDYQDATRYHSQLYYAITVDYPLQCAAAPVLTGTEIVQSGISGDVNKYIRVYRVGNGTSDFTLTPGTLLSEDFALESVVYGSAATEIEVADGKYTASVVGKFEPITIKMNYAAVGEVTNIILGLDTDTVTNLAVDQEFTYEDPLYDLTKITVNGDLTGVEGNRLYSVKDGSVLPDGIQLKDGKLYGRFTTANSNTTNVVFTVQGLNLTTADFTLKFGEVAKAVPQWEVPAALTATVGQTLGEIELPTDAKGTYSWVEGTDTSAVFDEATTVEKEICFTPSDTANYDWTAVSGWDEENDIIVFDINIVVEPAEPAFTVPTGLTATYGQTFGEIAIDSDEEGSFAWDTEHHALTDFVGEVGEHTCYVVYTPNDKNYKEKSGMEVTLTVNAATPTYEETLTEVEVICDGTLGDALLPDAEGGKYQWVSATTIVPVEGESYQVIYMPEDTTNYDWTNVTGWNKMRKGVVFSVKVKLEHAWGEGKVTRPATEKEEGVKTYECGLCGATRMEAIPKLPNSGGNGGAGSVDPSTPPTDPSAPAEPPTPQPPKVGYTISDSSSNAVYKVSKQGKEVTFVKPNKKTYTKVTVPATVTYEGVKYKVTAIANNACKSNSKLKTVKIGSNVKSIGSKAFYGCKKLTKVTIGSKVTTIGNSAFQNCTALKSITIPKNVSKIGSKAFYGCKKLTKMTIKTTKLTEKKVGKNAFTKMGSSNYKKVVVKVPKKQKKAYTKWLKKRGLNKKAKIK